MVTIDDCVTVLLRGARRYHIASLQDKNPIIAARHNGYAVALIDALRDISPRDLVGGVSVKSLRKQILAVQDRIEGEAFKLWAKLKKAGITIPEM